MDAFQEARYEELAGQIEDKLTKQTRVFVAISGFGGSGKSSLADKLQHRFKLSSNQLIRIDHLYSRDPNGPGMLDQVDWVKLIQILENAHAGLPLRYEGRAYRGEKICVDADLPHVVITEGIRLLQPRLMEFFDIAIWIRCPQDLALERAKKRDLAQGEDPQTVALWDSDWGPKDKAYFDAFEPEKLATFLY